MKIKEKIQANPCKYILAAFIIATCIFAIGCAIANHALAEVNERSVYHVEFNVTDKFVNEDKYGYYIVMSDTNNYYEIMNNDKGKEMFDKITVGSHYKFAVRSPKNTDGYMEIVEVYDEY